MTTGSADRKWLASCNNQMCLGRLSLWSSGLVRSDSWTVAVIFLAFAQTHSYFVIFSMVLRTHLWLDACWLTSQRPISVWCCCCEHAAHTFYFENQWDGQHCWVTWLYWWRSGCLHLVWSGVWLWQQDEGKRMECSGKFLSCRRWAAVKMLPLGTFFSHTEESIMTLATVWFQIANEQMFDASAVMFSPRSTKHPCALLLGGRQSRPQLVWVAPKGRVVAAVCLCFWLFFQLAALHGNFLFV